MIIGFVGNKGAGKDTAAAYLVEKYGFERRAFADPLKKSVAALFDIPFEDVDKLKVSSHARVLLFEGPQTAIIHHSGQTFRSFLQRYGTEAHRDVFGHDFWVDRTLPVAGYYAGTKICVSDVRFQNEVDRIIYLGGSICIIHRPGSGEKDHHRSEAVDELTTGLNTWSIINSDTIDHFHFSLDSMLSSINVGDYD